MTPAELLGRLYTELMTDDGDCVHGCHEPGGGEDQGDYAHHNNPDFRFNLAPVVDDYFWNQIGEWWEIHHEPADGRSTSGVLWELEQERAKQRDRWGNEADDLHDQNWRPEPTRRENLVKAAAMLVAEIERVDRAALVDQVEQP